MPAGGRFSFCKRRAGEEIRTLDILVGNEMLYQLSYARVFASGKLGEGCGAVQGFFSIEGKNASRRAMLNDGWRMTNCRGTSFLPPHRAIASK